MRDFNKAIQFQDPYTKVIENMLEKKLNPLLDKIEDSFFSQLKKSKNLYLLAGDSLGIKRLDIIRNFVFLRDFYSPMRIILDEYYIMSYKLGKKHILKELRLNDDKFKDVDRESSISIKNISEISVGEHLSSYSNLVEYVMFSVMKKNKNFQEFYSEVYNHPTFGKRKGKFNKAESREDQIQGGVFSSGSFYVSDVPSKRQFLGNAKAFVIKSFNKARVEVFNKLGIGQRVIYKTQQDEKVSSICKPFHDQEMSLEKAENSIPRHINCRCTFIPL